VKKRFRGIQGIGMVLEIEIDRSYIDQRNYKLIMFHKFTVLVDEVNPK
jgi:hypothetical protein